MEVQNLSRRIAPRRFDPFVETEDDDEDPDDSLDEPLESAVVVP